MVNFILKKEKFKILSTYRKKKLTNIYPLLTIKILKKLNNSRLIFKRYQAFVKNF